MRIKELSKKTGLSIHAIRFYEKAGLIQESAVHRLPNNYRDFDDKVIDTIRLIKYAQKIGFTLSEIREVVKDDNPKSIPTKKRLDLLEAKLLQIESTIKEINVMKRIIREKITKLRNP